MKDSRNILLLVVSLCLVGTWVYHIYDKNIYAANPAVVVIKDTITEQKATLDSLRMRYDNINNGLDTTGYRNTITGVDSLRNEIYTILHISTVTKEGLLRAKEKIEQLEQEITLISNSKQDSTTVSPQKEMNKRAVVSDQAIKPEVKKEQLTKPETDAALLNAMNISFKAIQGETKDQLATDADEAGWFSVSCLLQNAASSFNDAEVYIVVTDPQGNVIQDDQWQAGMFLTEANARIPYSRKSSFSYTKGDAKKITVSIKPPEIMRGSYSLQIYHKGAGIGKAVLRLN